jgi:hypothetical protein
MQWSERQWVDTCQGLRNVPSLVQVRALINNAAANE